MLGHYWAAEIWMVVTGLLASLFAGWIFGNPGLFLLLGALAYIAWHLYNLIRLLRWQTQSRSLYPPSAKGIWGAVFHEIHRLQQRNRKRKQLLVTILQRFRQSAEALPDAAVALTEKFEIEWYNEAADCLLGLRPRDAGVRISNLVRLPAFVAYLDEGDWSLPIEMPAPTDHRKSLQIRVVPYGENEFLLIARDMTLIQRLESMRRDFVANVSHEMRTPLTVLTGYLEAMRSMPDASIEEWRGFLEPMAGQAQRMQNLIEDLLRLSRLELDAAPPPTTAVDVVPMIEILRNEALAIGSGKDQSISVEADAALQLLGNADELRSVFSNLVVNAVLYTPPGGHISVKWEACGEGARLAVSDTGIGIPAHHIPRLTERFYRVDAARSRAKGGTGLGLAIVKHVLMRHGAQLKIASEEGKGSTFECLFPRERVRHIP